MPPFKISQGELMALLARRQPGILNRQLNDPRYPGPSESRRCETTTAYINMIQAETRALRENPYLYYSLFRSLTEQARAAVDRAVARFYYGDKAGADRIFLEFVRRNSTQEISEIGKMWLSLTVLQPSAEDYRTELLAFIRHEKIGLRKRA
ncbi:hypothetical protein Purlil1_10460 [Purpureocillium lilacinum]|uniref:Uncharacterized protein n=1 Tax=Purpureocillium lilacinum TaxID=33203 RepID=A0ABR0BN39_PURLI|nr:hypothetical protein Purlil1_10460 [Purpureocillium lilacinum]